MAFLVNDSGAGSRPAPPKPTIPDQTGRKTYIDYVYGGLVANTPKVQKAIADQYDYNMRRMLVGKKPLTIADASWNPNAYDDDMNEWMADRYHKTGKLPNGAEQLDYMQQAAAEKRKAASLASFKAEAGLKDNGGDSQPPRYSPPDPAFIEAVSTPPRAHSTADPNIVAGGLSQMRGNEHAGMGNAAQQVVDMDAQRAAPRLNVPTATVQGTGGGLGMLWGNNINAPGTPSEYQAQQAQAVQQQNSSILDTLDRILPKSFLPEVYDPQDVPQEWEQLAKLSNVANRATPQAIATNYMLGTVPAALKSLYLNALASGVLALNGKPVTYTPDMTMKDYLAKLARETGSTDWMEEANKISPWLGVPVSIVAEAASDPTSLIGLGEVGAITRGGRALKIGDAGYETALQSGKLMNTLGDAGDVGKIITEIKYKPSSGVILKANPDKTTTVLGNFGRDMKNIVNEMGNVKSTDFGPRKGGFNVLNVPDELYDENSFWDLYNKPWLDEAISRGDDIVLASKLDGNVLTRIDYSTGKEVFTGFGKEYDYLVKKGYIYDAATNTMRLK